VTQILAQLASRLGWGRLDANQKQAWERDGFLILPRFFGRKTLDPINSLIESIIDQRGRPPNLAEKIVVDLLTGPRAGQRVRLGDLPSINGPAKYNDLYLESDIIRACSLHPRLALILSQLLDGAPAICNSLNFVLGSEQSDHIDTWYMPPAVADKMVVTSVCLEDVEPDAGPLVYYPGSHKIPPYRFSHGGIHAIDSEMAACLAYVKSNLEERKLSRQTFLGRRGDVFIWAAQLVHGGLPIKNLALTRKSLVTHYWRADDIKDMTIATFAPGAYYIVRDHQPVPRAA
jgi:phytanoyl-CoA hydroxylase